MSIEELLKPRFEVIAEYPNCNFKIGDILKPIKNATNNWYFIEKEYEPVLLLEVIEKYSHLFKKLQWFEKRNEEEMPKYLKHTLSDKSTTYHKVKSYDLSNPKFIEWKFDDKEWGNFGMWAKDFNYMPCSEEEYLLNCNKA